MSKTGLAGRLLLVLCNLAASNEGKSALLESNVVECLDLKTELISGDQNGNIRVWDLTANSCSCELVPEVDTAVRSLTVMWDGSLVVAANNKGTCYVWRLLSGTRLRRL
ncbi:putative transcription factor WD40-like family [Helianthus debilis subsp. tardiflorus]